MFVRTFLRTSARACAAPAHCALVDAAALSTADVEPVHTMDSIFRAASSVDEPQEDGVSRCTDAGAKQTARAQLAAQDLRLQSFISACSPFFTSCASAFLAFHAHAPCFVFCDCS
eukprot:6190851-Pleurochrysis_carterae.AAC.1